MAEPDLRVNLGGIKLQTPILAASGPYGSGLEYPKMAPCGALGAIIVKGISVDPWLGNPPPRLVETASGLLNSIGLQNPGLKFFVDHDLPALRKLGPKIIVNIIGRTVEEYAAVASELNGLPGVDGLEVNISCPNLKAGGMAFGTNPALTAEVVKAVRAKTVLPLLVKLTPNVTDIALIAKTAEEAGADVISLINTLSGMLIDIEKVEPVLGNAFGGLSGPAIMPVALKMVWQVAETVSVPILGMGGITSAEDALQFIMAGARAVALGSGLFYDPALPDKVKKGIAGYLQRRGISSLSLIEGSARKGDTNNEPC